jgi:hypothetical protein
MGEVLNCIYYMKSTWKLHEKYMKTTWKLHENYMKIFEVRKIFPKTKLNYMKTTWKLHENFRDEEIERKLS